MKGGLEPHVRYRVEPLGATHDRSAFDCGDDEMNQYLRQRASQGVRRRVASVFVAGEEGSATICGFYTLSMASVLLDRGPQPLASKLPRYPAIPSVRLGRLAVHQALQRQGAGAWLLIDAMVRSVSNPAVGVPPRALRLGRIAALGAIDSFLHGSLGAALCGLGRREYGSTTLVVATSVGGAP